MPAELGIKGVAMQRIFLNWPNNAFENGRAMRPRKKNGVRHDIEKQDIVSTPFYLLAESKRPGHCGHFDARQ